ncbi:hypothetical protein Dda_7187 [Drechslerella dactyloides]|uniref:Uncharacterized protein n=1 Tax=Drechslerella dactyloides TaxID=74499 RepID=A0AAD6ITM2_DREDA|nr:hypothetical protein Dda_7187 [Drechslerella dactyloides]
MAPATRIRPKKPFLLRRDALQMLITVKHRAIAANHLIKGNTSVFDPLIMDASCQARAPPLIDACEMVRTYLEQQGKLGTALDLVFQWEAAHAADVPTAKTKTIEDVIGDVVDPEEYNELVLEVERVVGRDLFVHAGLCYTTTASANRFYDEFGSVFKSLDGSIYRAIPSDAKEITENVKNYAWETRHELATLSTRYLTHCSRQLASDAFREANLSGSPSEWESLEDQVAAALHYMTSVIEVKDGQDIPLQALTPQFLVIFLSEFRKNRGFSTMIRRMEMTPVESEIPGGPQDFTYKLSAARTLRWQPNQTTGRFELQTIISEEEAKRPGLFVELYSYYEKDSSGKGLDSANDDEYFSVFEQPSTDIFWVLMAIAAIHPAFTGLAKDKNPKHDSLYEAVCKPQPKSHFRYCREYCEGFALGRPTKCRGQNRPSLHTIRQLTRAIAEKHNLHDAKEFSAEHFYQSAERRRTPIYLTVKHIRALSYEEGVRFCEDLLARHPQGSKAIIGGYIARIGSRGFSCLSKQEGDAIITAKNKKAAMKKYQTSYPNNMVYLLEQ